MHLPPAAAIPLLTVAEYSAAGGDPRDLRLACTRGRLVRVRRGIYCHPGDWTDADPRARHLIRVRAVRIGLEREHIVAGPSAAAAWALPVPEDPPDDVTILVRAGAGGSSEPGVRQTTASATMGFRTATSIDGIPVTSIARTALDAARTLPFADAIAVLDHALGEQNRDAVTIDALRRELDGARFARGASFLARAVGFATSRSGSPGESRARAVMHELGFAAPELQVSFVDTDGEMRPDYLWRGAGVIGEFDGKVKYTLDEFSGGNPGEVVWREKRREDRLRRQPGVARVVRIVSADVADPRRLERLLLEAGVPRERPGYVMRSRGAHPRVVPERDQWQAADLG